MQKTNNQLTNPAPMSGELQIKVSIADDHKIFRDGIRMALKNKEYLKILWEAEDGKDLMHKMQIKKPRADIARRSRRHWRQKRRAG